MRWFLDFLAPVTVVAASVVAQAQTPGYTNVGRTPTAEEIRAWDIAVGPSGKELPPGSGTAREGGKIYAQKCVACHGPTGAEGLIGPLNRRLVGGQGTLTSPEPVRTIGSYWAFATTLWDFINRAMPPKEEGSLRAEEVYALTAFLLYQNGIVKQDDVLDAQSLLKVSMPNRDGFVPPRPEWKLYQDCSRFGLNCPSSLMVK